MEDNDDALLEPCGHQTQQVFAPFGGQSTQATASLTRHTDARLAVVYDQSFDRFFLRDHRVERSVPSRQRPPAPSSGEAVEAHMQWEQLILPPKGIQSADIHDPSSVPVDAEQSSSPGRKEHQSMEASPQLARCQVLPSHRPPSPKKTRVQNYSHHFARANEQTRISIHDETQHKIRWQGDVIRVNVATTAATINLDNSTLSQTYKSIDAHLRPVLTGGGNQYASDGQQDDIMGPADFDELKCIRPFPDGFRHVNEGCTFHALSSPSESESDEENTVEIKVLPHQSDSDDDAEPASAATFKRGDSVLVLVDSHWLKGTVLRRIAKSAFYDVRQAAVDGGRTLEAVPARQLRLLKRHRTVVKPERIHEYRQGEGVLWCPRHTNNDSTICTQHTYKARITAIRALHQRFDLVLRTGRSVHKVPYEELEPL